MPTPGSPTIVTSWQERCCAERSKVPIRSGLSSSRPTSGVVCVRVTSEPKRARGASGRKSASGSALPFTCDRLELLVVEDALGRRDTSAPSTAIPSTGAAPCRREAVLTTSPVTMPSPSSGRAPSATTASPVLMPMRTCSESAGSCLVQLLDRLQDAEAGADRALGIVLVRYRCAEDRHDRVPDELLDRAPVALDLLPQASVVGADAGADVLGVGRFRRGGEADEVAEEDGHDLALLGTRAARRLGQRRRAERAERETRPGPPYRRKGQVATSRV